MVERYKSGTARKLPRTAFKKGMTRPEGSGRKPGQKNRTTTLLKDAITGAAEELGMLEPIYRVREVKLRNGKIKRERTDEIIAWKPTGKGGTQGYMVWLGCHYPKVFGSLMSRTIPLQIDAKVDQTNQSVSQRFSNVDISKMTLTEKMAAMREMIGLTKPLPAPGPSANITDAEFSEIAESAE